MLTLLRDSLGFGGRLLDLLTLRGVGRQGDHQIPEIIHPKSPSQRFFEEVSTGENEGFMVKLIGFVGKFEHLKLMKWSWNLRFVLEKHV